MLKVGGEAGLKVLVWRPGDFETGHRGGFQDVSMCFELYVFYNGWLNQHVMIGRFQHVSISHISEYMSQQYVANIYKHII